MKHLIAILAALLILLSSCTTPASQPQEKQISVPQIEPQAVESPNTESQTAESPRVPIPTDLERACISRQNMQFNFTSNKCGCKPGFKNDLKRSGCLTSQELKAQCEFVEGAIFDSINLRCGCRDMKLVPSGFTNKCEERLTFLDQVCSDRFPGGKYNLKDQRCECPLGSVPSADLTTCAASPSKGV